jgi:hypothetical protein
MTCAQMAIIPKNNAKEARAAASSMRARNMIFLLVKTNEKRT